MKSLFVLLSLTCALVSWGQEGQDKRNPRAMTIPAPVPLIVEEDPYISPYPVPTWTEEEKALWEFISYNNEDPSVDNYTQNMVRSGYAWKDRQLSYDWSLIKVPSGLTPEGEKVFQSLITKARDHSLMAMKKNLQREERELRKALQKVSGLVAADAIHNKLTKLEKRKQLFDEGRTKSNSLFPTNF